MSIRASFRSAALLFGALTLSSIAHAQTTVSGTIETAAWTATNSPYRVTNTITVPAGNTLTIEAGVDVLFDTDVQFIVQGALHVHGTESDSVRFIKGTAEQWRGIRISGGDSSSFAYTRISDGNARAPAPHDRGGGLYIDGEDIRVVMEHSVISGNTAAENGGGLSNGSDGTMTLTNCTIMSNTAEMRGGGLYNGRSTLTLTNCTISGNTAQFGGKLQGGGLYNARGTATLTDCVISENTAVWGGGLYNWQSTATLTLTDCVISENTADWGGGLHNARGTATLTDCVISENTADWGGGGLLISRGTATLTNCAISGNRASRGGGLYNYSGGKLTLTNCTISGNTAYGGGGGGGLRNWQGGTLTLTNCTISENTADYEGGGVSVEGESTIATLTNSILWDNTAPASAQLHTTDIPTVTARYSNVQGGLPFGVVDGGGNINADPLFSTHPDSAYHLTGGSPCIDAGDPESPLDPDFTRADMGAYYFHQTFEPPEFLTVSFPAATKLQPYVAHILATNFGQSPLSFSLTDAPDWLSVGKNVNDTTCVLIGTPGNADTTAGVEVHVRAENLQSIGNEAVFVLAVLDTNYAPVWHARTDTVAYEGEELTFTVSAYDPDGDSLTYAAPVLPMGAVFTDSTFQWTPEVGQAGDTLAVFSVTDGEYTVLDTVLITVEPYVTIAQPVQFNLSQNAPNPFNPRTALRFSVAEAGAVRLVIYDVNGRLVRTLVDGNLSAGHHEVVWDARDNVGRAVASGVYVYRLTSGDDVAVRRMTLVR